MDPTASSHLVRRARDGSPDAVGALLETYGQRLLGLIRLRLGRRLRREVESRDVLQNTFLKAFEHVEQFEGSGSESFMGWLAGIACNEIRTQAKHYGRLCRDAKLRTSIRSGFDLPAQTLHSAVSRLQLDADRLALEEALEELSSESREVVLLRYYHELGFREIGERMSRSPDAARMLFGRAMAALSVRMKKSKDSR